MALRHLSTEDLITELFHFGIEVTEEERSKFKDNEVDGEAVDYGLTERMVSCLFEGSFKKQAKFNGFVQQWKETVTLTLEPVPVHSEKATAESSHAIPSSAFPAVFIIPKFPRDVQTKLDQKPPCKIERSDHNKIIRTLYETMALIKMFPTNDDYVKVCKALILKYPFLKDKEGNGYHTWHMSLKRKFKYERVPLVDDEEVRRMKQKFGHHKKPLQQEENTSKRAKASKKVDIIGEDDTSVASHVKVLQEQYRKTQPDAQMVEERMMRTFAWRRREIANGMTVKEAINKYPFLKSPCGLFEEMGRLHDEINICRRFEDGFKVLVPKVLSLTQRKSPLADLALEEREAALTEDVPGSEQSQHYNNDNGSQGNFGSGHGNFGSGHGNFGSGHGNFGSGHGNFGGGHGNDRPLHFIQDTVVCGEPWLEGGDPRAVGSIPPCLSLQRWGSGPVPGGSAEEEEAGVFAKTLSLQQGWTFGPFVGELTRGPLSCLKYAWAIKENDSYYFVDASDENKSNWMRYVACAACEEEHNLTVFQYRGQIFYRVSQAIPEGTELKVWIGQEYAAMLGLGIGENIKCEFGDKEILLRIFRDIQVVPVGGTSSLPDTNGSYSWSDNSQSGSPLPVISDVSSGLQTDTTDPTPALNPPQNTNQTGLATTMKYDFVKGAEILLSPSQPNSPVWEFFGFEPDPNGQPLDKDKVMCKLCGQQVDYSATITHLENHLVQMHHMKRRDVIKDGNKPWVSSSRFRPYHTTGGRALLSSSPSTHRTNNNNYSNEDWTWSSSSAVTDTVTVCSTTAATQGQRTFSNFLTTQTTNAITNFLIKDLLPLDTVEGEGFKQLIQTLLPSCKELPSASLLEGVLRDVHTKGRKNWAKLLTNSTGFNEEDTSKPTIPVQFKSSSSTGKSARSRSQTQNQVSHHVAVSADVWCHDWQGDKVRYATLWAYFINTDFASHNLALATQRLGETGTGDMDLNMVEATVRAMAQEWDISQPSFILLGGEEMEKTKVGPKKRERSGEGGGGGARHHHPNSTTFLEMEDSISSDDFSGLERAIEQANSTSGESHSPPIPCFFTAVQSCIEEVMGHSIISKTLSVFQHLLYSLFSLHDKDMVTLHPARKLLLVLQMQETAELKAWAYGKPCWNGLYSVVKMLLRYQNMISETLKQIDSEIQTGQDTGIPTDLDSVATAALKTPDNHDTGFTSASRANSDTTDSSNSSVPIPPKRSDWKVLEDLSSMLKPLDVACRTLAKEPFPRLSLVKPILTGLLDRHFAPHPRHRNDSAILKELKKKIRWGLARRYNDPQINQVLCVACALDPQFHGLGFMEVREQVTTFAWLKKEAVRILEDDRRRAEAASRGGRKQKRKKRGSSSSSSGEMEGDVLRRSKRLKEITPVSFKERTESDSDEEATSSSVNDDSECENIEPKQEPVSQQTGMEFLLGDLFSSQSQNKQPSVEETVDIELSVFRAEKGATLGVEPLLWWKARSGQLPLLARVARAYLAAPAVAGSAVQTFLQEGGGVIQRKRTNIPPEGLDQMLFLHHNCLTATTQGYTKV